MTDYRTNLTEALKASGNPYDMEKILRAFDFADAAHAGQLRKSGDPYISHPVEVAKILLTYDCDTDSIVAALLHDTVEDCGVTLDEIKKNFGPDVASLVDGVTKFGKIAVTSKQDEQIENLRKMLLAMAKDIRVILIKLADRLHNMRTMSSQDEDKQREKALETIEIYAPLAHRLGIQNLKSELEDTALRYLDPYGYQEIVEDLEVFASNNNIFNEIQNLIQEKLKQEHIEADISGRIKHIYSIYRKMFTQNKQFDEIYDLYAFRIIVDRVSDCYNVLGYMHDRFRAIPGRLKDYIATPKPNMYQSLHTTVSYKGYLFEIQIRTKEMHRTAEMGIAAHWKYKAGVFSSSDIDSRLEWVRKLLEVQKNFEDNDDFIQTFKIDLFADQVFVSTPKGDIITLPADATPIDFAYGIHSEVGNRMIGAKVNGRMVDLTTTLQNGDVVEILTSQNATGPSRDWLNIVRTNEAKSKIRQWFKREKREENIVDGREDLERELRRNNITFNNVTREELYGSLMRHNHCETVDDFYAAIGYGGISISKILPRLKEEYAKLQRQNDPQRTMVQNKPKKAINGVIVEDLDNCLVKLARCCDPLPGDPIVGFVTRGYGVTVHKTDCPHLHNVSPERLVQVHWTDGDNGYFAATLTITALERFDLLADIASVLASMRIVMRSMITRPSSDGRLQILLTVDVRGLEHLKTVATRIEKLRDVTSVQRSAAQ